MGAEKETNKKKPINKLSVTQNFNVTFFDVIRIKLIVFLFLLIA